MGVANSVLMQLESVKSFRGYDVVGGVVQLSDGELIHHLDETYGAAVICNLSVAPGEALQLVLPTVFDTIKGEYQEELQASLQAQLAQGNDVDIDFHD